MNDDEQTIPTPSDGQSVDAMAVIQNLLAMNSEQTMEIARLRAVVAKLSAPQPNRAQRRAKTPQK